MSRTGYWGDFESMADEQRAYEEYMQSQEPGVVPCPKCNGMMYEIEPECGGCRNEK